MKLSCICPMHFHPESSASTMADSLDECDVILNSAFNSTEGVRLYVRGHISAWGYQSLNFYQRLKRLPQLQSLGISELIVDSVKVDVIMLTSTEACESWTLRRGAKLYCRFFYDCHKRVTRTKNEAKQHDFLLSGLGRPVDWHDQYNNNLTLAGSQSMLQGNLDLMQGSFATELPARRIYAAIARSGALGVEGCVC